MADTQENSADPVNSAGVNPAEQAAAENALAGVHWKRNAAFFLGGQALTLFGSMVVQYAILWHIVLTTGSGSMMTVFSVILFLPMFFISPFAGVWADRFNRKRLINLADGAVALASLVVAALLFAGIDHAGCFWPARRFGPWGRGCSFRRWGLLFRRLCRRRGSPG